MASEKRQDIKNRIIGATIECIEKYGLNGATIRNIGDVADVNSSAISYYFGGRDKLLEIVWHITLENGFDLTDKGIKPNDEYITVIKKILIETCEGALKYPNIGNSHFQSIVNENEQGKIVISKMKTFTDDCFNLLVTHGMEKSDMQYKKLQVILAAFYGYTLVYNRMEEIKFAVDDFVGMLIENF